MSKQTPNHQEPQASTATVAKAAVSLREVTASTVRAVTDLRVAREQEGYVASNAVSIAQAYFHRDRLCHAERLSPTHTCASARPALALALHDRPPLSEGWPRSQST